ncbi:alpha/beta fold hydrolase [Oceanobacillus damuensis]|uniref:alpha/beta fold hydrolase n=1 Tax=Oceanobacillus damuensis TaxID=937928 RepID=UPI0009FFED3E|nr:alpha/beta fold hydrolase [Oceanobacillus damuensis]
MRNKRMRMVTAAGMLLFGMIIILNLPNKTKSELYLGEPTVFIHGYKGTANSFGFMLNRFEKKYGWGNKGLIYRVSKEGQIRDFNMSKGKHAPAFVQIILENNRASFADSTEWISNVLKHMKEKYYIDSVNLVGHSMGGIISVKYAMDYDGKDYPRVNKIIAIGSPFDGIYSEEYFHIHQDAAAMDLKPGSLALQLLKEGTFPADIEVLSIGSTGDVIALPESVQALRTIIPNGNLQEIIIENEKLGHSALHENKEVDKMIHSFLWQDDGL